MSYLGGFGRPLFLYAMITQIISIPRYRWKVKIYYAVTCYWTDEIMDQLRKVGISGQDERDAYENMNSCTLNNGITYSSGMLRRTVMVIAKTSSAAELFDSFFHELKHFEEQIGEICDIDQRSEEAAYLRGGMAKTMFPKIAPMLCDCCRKKHDIH